MEHAVSRQKSLLIYTWRETPADHYGQNHGDQYLREIHTCIEEASLCQGCTIRQYECIFVREMIIPYAVRRGTQCPSYPQVARNRLIHARNVTSAPIEVPISLVHNERFDHRLAAGHLRLPVYSEPESLKLSQKRALTTVTPPKVPRSDLKNRSSASATARGMRIQTARSTRKNSGRRTLGKKPCAPFAFSAECGFDMLVSDRICH